MKTEKEELGEELISKLMIGFMNQILSFEDLSEGHIFFDNLECEGELRDGRVLKVSLKELEPNIP